MPVAHGIIALALAITTAAAGADHGSELVLTIVAPASVRPGSVARIDLVGLNPGFGDVVSLDPNRTLSATFRTATESFPVTLEALSDAPMTAEPRGFATRRYSLTVPDAADGEATLTVAAGDQEVAAAMLVARDAAADAREPLPASPAVEAFPRTLHRLTIYQPNYFIYGGGGEPAAKFQLSLKYRALTFGKGTPERPRPSLQLAYTQRALWDMRQPSEPFYDTSYMPEVFVEYLKPASEHEGSFSFLGWGLGWRHESNGKDGEDSRAWDIVFARAGVSVGSPEAWYLAIAPEIWHHIGRIDNMPDIEDYRGYGRLYFVAGHASGPSLSWTLTPADGFNHVTHQLDLSLPVGVRRLSFATYLFVQYFDGYAESLRNYRHESQSLRFGFSLVR